MVINAGGPQPEAVRQLTAPPPCSPPTIKPALVRSGITAMHLAWPSTEVGIWLEDVMFCNTCAAASNSFAASAAQASQQNIVTNIGNRAEHCLLQGDLLRSSL